jgi:hypothetical protein
VARRADDDRPVHARQDPLCRPIELHHPHRAAWRRADGGRRLGRGRAVGRVRLDVAMGLRRRPLRAAAAAASHRPGGGQARPARAAACAASECNRLCDGVPAARRARRGGDRRARRLDARRQCGAGLVLCRVAQRPRDDRDRHRPPEPPRPPSAPRCSRSRPRGLPAISADCGSRSSRFGPAFS